MTFTNIELGHGNVSIGALCADDGKHGVNFYHTPDVEIGETTHVGGRTENDTRPLVLQIRSTCPESLDVLIHHLMLAKSYYNGENLEAQFRA